MQIKGAPHPFSVTVGHIGKKKKTHTKTLQVLWHFSSTSRTVSAVKSIIDEHKCAIGLWKTVKVGVTGVKNIIASLKPLIYINIFKYSSGIETKLEREKNKFTFAVI